MMHIPCTIATQTNFGSITLTRDDLSLTSNHAENRPRTPDQGKSKEEEENQRQNQSSVERAI